MAAFLITVRDEAHELECTSTFEGDYAPTVCKQSIEYYANVLERPANMLRVVAHYLMEGGN